MPPHLGASMYAIACILSYDSLAQSSVQTVAVQPIASVVDGTSPRDEIPSANHNELREHDPDTTPMESKLELANQLGLDNMEESSPLNLADGNEQPDPNTALVEDILAATQQNKMQSESKRCKSLNNVDLGNMEENTPSDLANGNVQTLPKSASNLDMGNMEKNMPSDLVNGNEKTESKSTNNMDLGNMEENMSSDLANGNEQKEPKSVSKLDLGKEKENIPSNLANENEQLVESISSNLANENEQLDPNIAPTDNASAAKQPEKMRSRSKRCKSGNNLDLGKMEKSKPSDLANGNEQTEPKSENIPSDMANENELTELKLPNNSNYGNMEESLPFNLANGDEQPDLNTTPMEPASAAKQPKKKRSRSKKRKSVDNLDLGNMVENKPSDLAYGNELKEPKSVSRLDPGKEKESIPSNHVSGNEQSDSNTAPAAKKPKRKKRKLADNLDSGNNMEGKMPSTIGLSRLT